MSFRGRASSGRNTGSRPAWDRSGNKRDSHEELQLLSAADPVHTSEFQEPGFRPKRTSSQDQGDGMSRQRSPYTAPTFQDGCSRSHSPPAIPCVAHPVYTAHTNCGCHGSPRKVKRPQSLQFVKLEKATTTPRSVSPRSVSPPPPKTETPRPPPFSEPQLIGTVGVENVRFAKVPNPQSATALIGSKSGVLRRGRAIGGEVDVDEAPLVAAEGGRKQSVVTAMEVFSGDTWCGFKDGSIRVYSDTGNLLAEASRHSAATTCFSQIGLFVYSGGLDGKIYRWNLGGINLKNGLTKLHALSSFGSHKLGIRALVSDKVLGSKPMLVSGSDDGEIRCWNLNCTAPSADDGGEGEAAYFPLKGHSKGVLSLFLRRDTVWSGGEDATVRIWKLGSRKNIQSLDGHSSAVVCIQRIGEQNVWTLGKNGQAVVYHVDTQQVLHSMLFTAPSVGSSMGGTISVGTAATPTKAASGRGPSSKTTPATMLHLKPVQGHIMWVTEPSGITQSWYCPTPVDPDELLDLGGRSGPPRGINEFELAELQAQQQMELEAAQSELVDGLIRSLDEHSVVLLDHLDESLGNPKAVTDIKELAARDAEIEVLQEQLKSAQNVVAELKADCTNAKALEALDDLLKEQSTKSKVVEEKLQKLLTEARRKNKDVETRLKMLMASKERSVSEEQGAVLTELAALKEKDTQREAVLAKQKKQIDDLKRQLIESNKTSEATRQQLENSNKELKSISSRAGVETKLEEMTKEAEKAHQREMSMQTDIQDMCDELMTLRDERVAHLAQLEDRATVDRSGLLEELAQARTETKKCKAEVDKINQLLNKEKQFSSNHSNEAARVQAEYEANISSLTKQFQEKAKRLESENSLLRRKGEDNVLLNEIDALRAEISKLKKELTMNRHHVTRLAAQDMQNRKNGRVSGKEDCERVRSVSETQHTLTPPKFEEHNPGDPHHMAHCVWCNGASLRGVGGTFGYYGSDYKQYCRQEDSKERFKQGLLSPHRSASANGGNTPEAKHTDPRDMLHHDQSPHPTGYAAAYAGGPRSSRSRSAASDQPPHAPTLTPLEKQKSVPSQRKVKKDDLVPVEVPPTKRNETSGGAKQPQHHSGILVPRLKTADAAKEQVKGQPSRAALVAEILALHNEILDEKDAKTSSEKGSVSKGVGESEKTSTIKGKQLGVIKPHFSSKK